jgi:type VI protein secretion system component Hcp
MVLDGYFRISGIRGECQEGDHRGWIDATRIDWKVDEGKPVVWYDGLRAAVPASITPVTFKAKLGRHSVPLFMACLTGEPFETVEFDIMTAAVPTKHQLVHVELSGCVVTSCQTGLEGATPVDTIKVVYSTFRWGYQGRTLGAG